MKTYLLFVFLLLSSLPSFSQKLFSGIVIDSASFEEVPGVVIHVKHSDRWTITTSTGHFRILANQQDTLTFTMLGYQTMELPLLYEEDVMLLRISEQVRMLDEVTIRATRLYPNEILNRTKTAPRKMSALDGFGSPFDYFSRLEKEKRKLTRIVEENNRTQTYVQVITDPIVKDIMMKAYDLRELAYYEHLSVFNQRHPAISYSNDPEEIMEALHAFFLSATSKK